MKHLLLTFCAILLLKCTKIKTESNSTTFDANSTPIDVTSLPPVISGENLCPFLNCKPIYYKELKACYINCLTNGSDNMIIKGSSNYSNITVEQLSFIGANRFPDDLLEGLKIKYLTVSSAENKSLELTKNFLRGISSLKSFSSYSPIKSIETGTFAHLAGTGVTSILLMSETNQYGKSTTVRNNNTIKNEAVFSLSELSTVTSLEELQLGSLNMTDIDFSHINQLKNLTKLYLAKNIIMSLRSSLQTSSLRELYLYGNKIGPILDTTLFSSLDRLEYIDLNENVVESFSGIWNTKSLKRLNLASNKLTQVPNITELSELVYLDLSHNQITTLASYSFERKLKNVTDDDFSDEESRLGIHLYGNNLLKYGEKAFCSRYANVLNGYGVELIYSNFNYDNRCVLKQLKNSFSKISSYDYYELSNCSASESLVESKCKLKKYLNEFNISVDSNNSCNDTSCAYTFVDDCDATFTCDFVNNSITIERRRTTWITGDPHVSSYNKGYQICNFDEQETVCFESARFTIYCTDRKLTTRFVSVLSRIRIVYKYNGVSYSFLADNTSFPSTFSNGQTFIQDELNNKIFLFDENSENYKTIYDSQTNSHIYISRWNSFYSLTFRARESFYSSSTGVLVNGCSGSNEFNSTNTLTKRSIQRQIVNQCGTSCQNFANNSVENIEMTRKNIYDICFFDCLQVGDTRFTSMLSQSVFSVNMIQSTDNSSLLNDLSSTTTTTTTTKNSCPKLRFNLLIFAFSLLTFLIL